MYEPTEHNVRSGHPITKGQCLTKDAHAGRLSSRLAELTAQYDSESARIAMVIGEAHHGRKRAAALHVGN